MPTIIVSNPVQVDIRLQQLGIDRDKAVSVVEAMVTARNMRTENDPLGSGGLLSWIMGTRRLREVLIPEDWERDNSNHTPTVVNAKHGVRIAVLNADDGTGVEDRTPQPRSKKGAATETAVSGNQAIFDEIFEHAVNVVPMNGQSESGISQYYLFVYHQGEVVRAELSCPVGYANGGFTDFRERIIIETDGTSGTPSPVRKIKPDDESGFEIPVIRKAL